ncbi:MAG TPA: hypothetical protein VK533_00340 [Sphingomonas sp.]|uniref:hypothetical protein n=1 Tax=Sphingomonas sp. TaxID=28214 RepID=UPI002D030991|nr:hypothetical protein [Sphingomonas sp.]HMI17966.1 hypothetical protein [Sphingomonas sp.]
MRKSLILCSIPLLALAACHADVDVSDVGNGQDGDNVHIAMQDKKDGGSDVSVNVPGFNANVSLPHINLAGHMDLDGIKLAPNTKVSGLNVDAHDDDKGTNNGEGVVRMAFTNTDGPAAVIDHYARSAADAGYGDIARTGSSLSAKKDDKTFAVEIGPDGSGSKGTITITGKDND